MHPVDLTTNLPSSSDAQGNVGQEQAEHIVQEPKVLNATILEHITEAFIALDRQWRITYCNEKAASLTPRTREELLGKNLWETFPEIVGSTFYLLCQKAPLPAKPSSLSEGISTSRSGFASISFPHPTTSPFFSVTSPPRNKRKNKSNFRRISCAISETASL